MSGIKIGERLDLYATLGLNRSSRDLDLKRAYKKLALSNHPDKNKGTETEFLYIGFAYHVLSNPKLRAVYDANEVEFATSRQKLIESFNSEKALEIFDAFFGKIRKGCLSYVVSHSKLKFENICRHCQPLCRTVGRHQRLV